MKELISLYDNALIYYPNVFFPVLFSLSILGIIFVSIEIIVLSRKIRRVVEEIKSNLNNKKKKVSFVSITRVFLKRKKIFFIHIRKVYLFTKAYLIRTNTLLARLELQIKKIVKKIGKEIIIEE